MLKFFHILFAGMLFSALSAADGVITLKSAKSVKIEVEKPSQRIGAPSYEEHFQPRNQLVTAEKMLKTFLPELLPGAATGETVTIKVGTNVLGAKYKLPKLNQEEFMIAFPDAKTIVIAGGNQIGARNGVSEFLQRFCGMRWLFTGEAGLHLPKHTLLKIPMKSVRSKPHFRHRTLSKVYAWSKRTDWNFNGWYSLNRGSWDINFTHGLYQLFPVKMYRKTHPHFYPSNLAKNPSDDHWNPVLSAPGLTEEAIKRICAQFKRSPEQHSYSLGINDISTFEGGQAKGINSVGRANYSDYYYGWANKVIEGVSKHYPDKYFGMIAYESVTDPPSFKLHPRAVPFICIERLRWYDKDLAEKDMQFTKQWRAKTSRLGWYDYIYGDLYYMVPRIYNTLLTRQLKFAAKNGITDFFGEANSSELPTEGPKMWLVLQLLWNPDADAEALLTEWYDLAVGKAAAPHLRSYFDYWEKFWRERVPKGEWFNRYKNSTYFDFWDHSYTKGLNWRDITYCDNAMKKVVAGAGTAAQKRRAELFMKSWKAVRANIIYTMQFYTPIKGGGEIPIYRNDFNKSSCLRSSEHPAQGSWMFWQTQSGRSTGVWEEKSGVDGKGALAVHLKTKARWCFTTACSTRANTVYRFRCRMQVENTGSSGKIYVGAFWRDKNNVQVNKYFLIKDLDAKMRDGKWHTVEIQFCQPPIEKPTLNLHIGGKDINQGTVRIDNVELSAVLPPKKQNAKK